VCGGGGGGGEGIQQGTQTHQHSPTQQPGCAKCFGGGGGGALGGGGSGDGLLGIDRALQRQRRIRSHLHSNQGEGIIVVGCMHTLCVAGSACTGDRQVGVGFVDAWTSECARSAAV
jgi:hypothetical protein